MQTDATARRLEVAVQWGDDRTLDVLDVTPGADVRAHALGIPIEDDRTLLRADGREYFVLLPDGSVSHVLRENEDTRLGIGDLTVRARWTAPIAKPESRWWRGFDVDFAANVAILVIAALVLVKMFGLSDRSSVSFADDVHKQAERVQIYRTHIKPPPPKQVFAAPSAPKAPKPEGRYGDRKATQPAAQASRGGQKVDGDKRVRDLELVRGKLAFLAGADSVFRGGGIGGDALNRVGGIDRAGPIGDMNGTGGLGSRGEGPGGGGPIAGIPGGFGGPGVRLGPGGDGLAIDGRIKVPTVPVREIIVERDNIDRSVIARTVQRHWNEIRHCYELGLQRNPNLVGKVAVRWVIGPTGMVTEARISDASLDDAQVQSCIVSRVQSWGFPAPRGGGIAEVNYPFVLSTTGG